MSDKLYESVSKDSDVMEGKVLNRKGKVQVKLGAGAFSTVWKCLHIELGSEVAVKVVLG